MWAVSRWGHVGAQLAGDVLLEVPVRDGEVSWVVCRPFPGLLQLHTFDLRRDQAAAGAKSSLLAAWRFPSDISCVAHTGKGVLAVVTLDGNFYQVSWPSDTHRPFPTAQEAAKVPRGTEEDSTLTRKRPSEQTTQGTTTRPVLQRIPLSSAVYCLPGGQRVAELRYFGGGVLSKPALLMARMAPSSLLMLDWRKQSIAKRLQDLRTQGEAADPVKSSLFPCGGRRKWSPSARCSLVLCATSDTKATGTAGILAASEHLFGCLAGAEGSLAGRKLFLQGLEDGRVVCSVLPAGVRGGARLEKARSHLEWRTVVDIQEPICALLGAQSPLPEQKEPIQEPINMVVVVGSQGRICVLLAGHEDMPLERHVYHLRTNVTAAVCTAACRLVYMAQSSLHVVELLDRAAQGAYGQQPHLSSILVPTSLPLAHRVVSLQLAADETLLAATTTGALLSLHLPQELRDLQLSNAELASPEHLQHSMKTLLKDITEVAHKQEELARKQTFLEQEVAQVGAAINFAADLRRDPSLLRCQLTLEPEARVYKSAVEETIIPVSLLAEFLYRGKTEVSSSSWSLLFRFKAGDVTYSRSVELPTLTQNAFVAIRVDSWFDIQRPLRVEAFLCFACSGSHTCEEEPGASLTREQPLVIMLADSLVTALDCLRPFGHIGEPTLTKATYRRLSSLFHSDRLHHFLHATFLHDRKAGQRPAAVAAQQSSRWCIHVEAPQASFLQPGELLALLATGKHTSSLPDCDGKWQLGPFGVHLICSAAKKRGGGLDRGIDVVVEAPVPLAAGLASALLQRLLGQADAYEALFVKKAGASPRVSAKTLVAVYARLLTHVDRMLHVRAALEDADMVAFLQGLCGLDLRSSSAALELARYSREQLATYTSLRCFE